MLVLAGLRACRFVFMTDICLFIHVFILFCIFSSCQVKCGGLHNPWNSLTCLKFFKKMEH